MQDVDVAFHLAARSNALVAVGELQHSFQQVHKERSRNVFTRARDAAVNAQHEHGSDLERRNSASFESAVAKFSSNFLDKRYSDAIQSV